ncbi:unconventional myosin, partial [Genlisea aurea]
GVMEAIRISCAGYPTRKHFHEFISRFRILEPDALARSGYDEVAACCRIIEKAGLEGYQIGKTKVFLRAGQMAELDSFRSKILGQSARIIQRKFLTFSARKNFLLLRISAVDVQAVCRGQIARFLYEHKRRIAAAETIQKDARMFLRRKAYLILSSSAAVLQAGMRGMAARSELRFRKRSKAAVIIQRHSRGYLAHCWYLRLKAAAIGIQCSCRENSAFRELQRLKMAAKETGALQEAKSKLEKQVEDLKLELQREKKIRVEIEEEKNRELEILRSTLEDIKLRYRNADIVDDQQGGKLAEENEKLKVRQVFTVNYDPITHCSLAENEKLKVLVSSLEKKIDETEKEMEKLCEDRLKQQAMEAESNIIQLKTEMLRLQEKISDIEATEDVMRQQSLSLSFLILILVLLTLQAAENGHYVSEALLLQEPQSLKSTPRFSNSDATLRKSNVERQRDSVDALIRCITEDVGFSEGKPVAALTVYKCLIHWRSFEAEKTNVFDRLIQIIGSAIEDEANNDRMAYWLSNASTLLFLLERTLKSASSSPPQPTSFFGRMAQSFRSSPSFVSIGGLEGVQQVEAKYPALLFKEQLSAYVETIYGVLHENSKTELSVALSSCIRDPPSSDHIPRRSSDWESVIGCLNNLLSTLKHNYVSAFIVRKFFAQLFSYINLLLFNSLLLHKDYCTSTHGDFIKAGLVELELWCRNAEEFAGSSAWDELKHVQQAVRFLVLPQKSEITFDELTNEVCPMLSSQQVCRICNLYLGDNSTTDCIPSQV